MPVLSIGCLFYLNVLCRVLTENVFGSWVTGEWGSCSVTCGKGIQQREVGCVYQLQNGSLIHTRELYCQGSKPPVILACEGQLCLSVWEASEWSKVHLTHHFMKYMTSGIILTYLMIVSPVFVRLW